MGQSSGASVYAVTLQRKLCAKGYLMAFSLALGPHTQAMNPNYIPLALGDVKASHTFCLLKYTLLIVLICPPAGVTQLWNRGSCTLTEHLTCRTVSPPNFRHYVTHYCISVFDHACNPMHMWRIVYTNFASHVTSLDDIATVGEGHWLLGLLHAYECKFMPSSRYHLAPY